MEGVESAKEDVRYVMGEVLQVMTARVSGRKADRNSGVSLRFEKETMRSEGRGEEAWEIIMTG